MTTQPAVTAAIRLTNIKETGMGCCNEGPVVLFKNRLLSDEAGVESDTDSAIVEMMGDELTIQVLIHNIAGTTATLTAQVRGSVNGQVWKDVGAALNRTTFGEFGGTISNVQYRFIKVKFAFTTSSGTGNVIFDAAFYTYLGA